MRTNQQTGAKNHFNFRLRDQIDTIKQTDKNNDHSQRNKTNEPVRFERSHKLAGNAHFCRFSGGHETFFGANYLRLEADSVPCRLSADPGWLVIARSGNN